MSTLLSFGAANALCAAVLAAFALLVGRYCRRPALLHGLWLLVLLKLVTPPLWPITVAEMPDEPDTTVATPSPTPLEPPMDSSFGVEDAALLNYFSDQPTTPKPIGPANKANFMEAHARVLPPEATTERPHRQLATPVIPAAEPAQTATRPTGLAGCVPLLGIVWLAGSGVWLAWAAIRVCRFHRLLRHDRRAGAEIQEQSDRLAARMGLRRGPEIWLLPGSLPPLVWAAFGRARVFFPAKLLPRLEERERESLLAHELAHVRRRDHWVRWLELIASALYWWYPLVWLARRRLHLHEEECCDAWAIGEIPARTYAGAILNTLDFLAEDRAPLPIMASGLAGVELLKRRLGRIMDGSAPKCLSLSGKIVLVLAGLLLLSLRPNLAQTETNKQSAATSEPADTSQKDHSSPPASQEDAESFQPDPMNLRGKPLTVGAVAFSPDGKRLAMAAGWIGTSGEVRIWDVDKGRTVATVRTPRHVRSVAFSPDGKILASAEFDGTVKLRDPATAAVRATLGTHKDGVNSAAFSPDGKSLAAAGLDNDISIWDVATAKRRRLLKGHSDFVLCVAYSPNGKTLVSTSRDKSAILWDVETGKIRATLKGHSEAVEFAAFAPDGKTVATGAWDGTVKLWDAAQGKEKSTLQGPGGIIFCLRYSPDGKTLAVSGPGSQGKVQLWDTGNPNVPDVLETEVQGIYGLAFSPDGKRLAVSSREGEVKLWDVVQRKELAAVEPVKERLFEPQPVLALAYSPVAKTVAVAGEDGRVQLCELSTGIQRRVLKGHADVVTCLAFSPDGKWLATGSPDKKIKLWDPATGKEIRTLAGHANWIYALAFAADGKTLASGSYDKTIRLWDPATGKERRILKGHTASVRALGFSPDGKTLASGSGDRTIRLWPMGGDGEPVILKGHTETIRVVAFSPDCKTLASGSEDHTVKLWDVEKKSERATLKAHNAEVTALTFSRHGRILVSGAAGGGIVVWDAAKGNRLSQLPNHSEAVTGLLFAGSRQLLSASLDGTVKIWQGLPPPVRVLRGHTGPVVRIVISRDGRRLLSCSGWPQGDKTARLWDLKTGKELRVFRAETPPLDKNPDEQPNEIKAVALSPDGKQAVSAGVGGVVFLWDVETGKELRRLHGHAGTIYALDFAPDGRHVLSGGRDKTIRLWEAKSGREVRKFEGHTNWVMSVRFAREGKRFLSGGRDGVMRLWEVDSGKQLRQFQATQGWTDRVAWLPNQRQAICATGGGVELWDVESGKLVRTFKGHAGGVTCVDVSRDGRSILSGGYDGTVRCWDVASGQQRKLFRQPGFVRAVKFSPDGRYAISAGGGRREGDKHVRGGDDFPIRVWALDDARAARK
jgi:WD40 repeat protein/beta-lactamase regulating signal transducer with metallopeptidase domain